MEQFPSRLWLFLWDRARGGVVPFFVYSLFIAAVALQLAKDLVKKFQAYSQDPGGDAAFIDQIGAHSKSKKEFWL